MNRTILFDVDMDHAPDALAAMVRHAQAFEEPGSHVYGLSGELIVWEGALSAVTTDRLTAKPSETKAWSMRGQGKAAPIVLYTDGGTTRLSDLLSKLGDDDIVRVHDEPGSTRNHDRVSALAGMAEYHVDGMASDADIDRMDFGTLRAGLEILIQQATSRIDAFMKDMRTGTTDALGDVDEVVSASVRRDMLYQQIRMLESLGTPHQGRSLDLDAMLERVDAMIDSAATRTRSVSTIGARMVHDARLQETLTLRRLMRDCLR